MENILVTKVAQFHTVQANNPTELDRQVNSSLAAGWALYGKTYAWSGWLCQTVVKVY